ncbi:MAG: ribosome biogenesis GTPase Der [Fibrobacterota bacterium]
MSGTPVVSIVGRPNVGKSSLFNRILRRRVAVVDDMSGVTRDRNYMNACWNDHNFSLVDTGGIIPNSRESLPEEIHRQVDIAMGESAVIVFVVEGPTGPTDLDEMIAGQLRRNVYDKVILAVNKAENHDTLLDSGRLISLGLGTPLPISALHGNGVADLLDKICEMLGNLDGRSEEPVPEELGIAVIGRPNVGKSSFVNKLLKEQRMIVDNAPGTTRDAIDSTFTYKDIPVRIIDTAGMRRKSQVKQKTEYYSNLRALSSIQRAHIVVLMIDTMEGISEQDMKIFSKVSELRKGIIVCYNKWDLVEKDHKTFDLLVQKTRNQYMEMKHYPMISISALTGRRVFHVIDTALEIRRRMTKRITPAQFREQMYSWLRAHPHPYNQNKSVRILGGKQVAQAAFPLFEFYVNHPRLVLPSYERFLMNKIQDEFDFIGCPVTLLFKPVGKNRHKQHNTEQIRSD